MRMFAVNNLIMGVLSVLYQVCVCVCFCYTTTVVCYVGNGSMFAPCVFSADPLSMSPQKALETIGANLQKQYENWQPRVSEFT